MMDINYEIAELEAHYRGVARKFNALNRNQKDLIAAAKEALGVIERFGLTGKAALRKAIIKAEGQTI